MGREWLLPAAVAGATLIVLVACADGEGPETVVPPAIAATVDVPEPVIEEGPEGTPAPIIREKAVTSPDLRERRIAQAGEALSAWESNEGPLPTWELPDDIALLVNVAQPYQWESSPAVNGLMRIYWRYGAIVRETLLFPDNIYNWATVDGTFELSAFYPSDSLLGLRVCVEKPCIDLDRSRDDEPLGRHDYYESWDGGVTWKKVVTPMPSTASSDLRISNGLILLPVWDVSPYRGVDLREAAPMGDYRLDGEYDWPTIRDLQTGEERPVRLHRDVLMPGETLNPIAVQRGPFLRVVDVGDCLPVLSDQSLDAEELACAAERVLLTDLGEASEVDGITWHRVRTPSGIEGWADGRWLE